MSDSPLPKKRPSGLGRGLSSLLGEVAQEAPVDGSAGARSGSVQMIPVAGIEPHPGQPRRIFQEEALAELAESIRARGVIQPIVVRPHGHRFQIVAGERRWRAAQRARLHEIPAIVRDFSDEETLEVALIENIQRQDLNAIEEAQAYKRLVDEFSHTQEELARIVHKSRSHVANLLRLLDLPAKVQIMVGAGELSMGHARALLTVAPPAAIALARQAVEHGWSVREVEHRVQQLSAGKVTPNRTRKAAPGRPQADIAALERELSESLGSRVNVLHGRGGKGRLVIHYSDLETLDGVLERLRTKA